jgi:hypothetical protein
MPDKSAREMDEKVVEEVLGGRRVLNPADIPRARLLTGYLTRSQDAWRLYTADMRSYIDIGHGDLLGTERLPATANSPAKLALWVNREANLKRVWTKPPKAPAQFLSGDIISRALRTRTFDLTDFPITWTTPICAVLKATTATRWHGCPTP